MFIRCGTLRPECILTSTEVMLNLKTWVSSSVCSDTMQIGGYAVTMLNLKTLIAPSSCVSQSLLQLQQLLTLKTPDINMCKRKLN